MARVKRGVASRKYRKKVLKSAKGFYGRSKNCYSIAIQKVEKGGQYSYRDRRAKKRDFRALWIIRLNAGLRELGIKYSSFMNLMKIKNIHLNRKILADLAANHNKEFSGVVHYVMNA